MAHFVKKVFDCRDLRVEIVQIMCLGRGWLNSLPCHLGHAKKPLAIARTLPMRDYFIFQTLMAKHPLLSNHCFTLQRCGQSEKQAAIINYDSNIALRMGNFQ